MAGWKGNYAQKIIATPTLFLFRRRIEIADILDFVCGGQPLTLLACVHNKSIRIPPVDNQDGYYGSWLTMLNPIPRASTKEVISDWTWNKQLVWSGIRTHTYYDTEQDCPMHNLILFTGFKNRVISPNDADDDEVVISLAD